MFALDVICCFVEIARRYVETKTALQLTPLLENILFGFIDFSSRSCEQILLRNIKKKNILQNTSQGMKQ